MAEKILKSIKFPGLEDTYILPVTKDAEETSLIGNDLENNQALGIYSTALGRENIAGAKGYYIKNIDVASKKIHLSTTECVPTFEANYNNGEDIDLSAYEVGEYIDITAYGHYHWILCSTIDEVGSGYIFYDSDIDDSSSKLTTGAVPYYFSVPSKPLSGIVVFADTSFAEGRSNIAAGQHSHVEGGENISTGRFSHAEGFRTISGYGAHAEGEKTIARGLSSHAEGSKSKAYGNNSHAEGNDTIAAGSFSHAEGLLTEANGKASHSEGQNTVAAKDYSHAEGYHTTANNLGAHSQNLYTVAEGRASHAEGEYTIAAGSRQHVQGKWNDSNNELAHIVGNGTSDTNRTNAHTLSWEGTAWFDGDVYIKSNYHRGQDEGSKKLATEEYVDEKISPVEYTISSDVDTKEVILSSSNGSEVSRANIDFRVTTGQKPNVNLGSNATSEGINTSAIGTGSHAEGYQTTAGDVNKPNNGYGHAEGAGTVASGHVSHAEGYYTTASEPYQHVQGKYNYLDENGSSGNYLHIVGNGSSSVRSNAHTLDWNGNAWFAGDITLAAPANETLPVGVTLSSRLPRLYFGTIDPTNLSFGKNGDIYIMIEE